jgi:hypothetical protein
VRFPPSEERREFKEGEWVDVERGRSHEVWVGGDGCGMVIGEQSGDVPNYVAHMS